MHTAIVTRNDAAVDAGGAGAGVAAWPRRRSRGCMISADGRRELEDEQRGFR